MTQQQPEEAPPLAFEQHVLTELAVLRGCISPIAVSLNLNDPLLDYPVARAVRGLSSVAVETELQALHAGFVSLADQVAPNRAGSSSDTQGLREELRRLDAAVADRLAAIARIRESLAGAQRGVVRLVHRDSDGEIAVIEELQPGESDPTASSSGEATGTEKKGTTR